ncbi:TetR/AcrR family transcriptional regulator C-terminal domain-containing protein [Pseudonocardia nigra]|uniref:TetR/AcrR family transcriptional regulator C-terminal domain-containing protein n=1 Tax=Pseudonocardia nigra TaxID=1921578 RepID=UPI001C5E2B33|nr:TetR/AcrR family transcriptional regulator C-terminal domain-containing protein [Pseudonocardia nigra]
MVVYAGQGDARRAMALLWRGDGGGEPRRGPGPRPALSVDAVVDAAIAVAGAQGMAALSMRAVGERLGRTAMALYTYVPSKGELVDLMYDRVLAEVPTDYDLGAGWRAALTAWAGDMRAFYLRHPWVLQVSQARPVLGPHEFALRETVARILRATGLGPSAARSAFGALFHVVRGSAQAIAEAREAAAATDVSDEEWWSARSGLLEGVAPGVLERFPAAAWIEGERAPEPEPAPLDDATPYLEREADAHFAATLALVLDGIDAALARHRTQA